MHTRPTDRQPSIGSHGKHNTMDSKLKDLEHEIITFRDRRDWAQFHSPKNLSQALGIEAAELQEIFLWKSSEDSRVPGVDEKGFDSGLRKG